MQVIASPHNPLVKEIRKAQQRGGLTDDGCVLAETFHLVEEALKSGCEIAAVVVSETMQGAVEAIEGLAGTKMVALPEKLFVQLVSTESSQGVIALVRPRSWTVEEALGGSRLVIVLDAVQDPGNAGAIVRASEAFGASGALFLKGSVNPYNPKTLRASAGSLFRMPVVTGMDAEAACVWMEGAGIPQFATVPGTDAITLDAVDLAGPCAIIVGNESRGVSETLRRGATLVTIPTEGVESLNAAMAATVMLYEARRQRRTRRI